MRLRRSLAGNGGAAVCAVVGCVKSPIPDLAVLVALYGEGPRVVEAVHALVDGVPLGPPARAPRGRAEGVAEAGRLTT